MKKRRFRAVIIITAVITAGLTGFFLFSGQSDDHASNILSQVQAYDDLGITYLNITEGLAEYYGLEITSGSLVTEVSPGSPAAVAGLKNGDVILSFNGSETEEQRPLLGMMMDCPLDHEMILEVWRQNHVDIIRIMHNGE